MMLLVILTYTLVSNGTLGNVISFNNGNSTFTYSPDANTHGSDSLVFSVVPMEIESPVSATYDITITPVNDAPTFDTPAITINEDSVYNGELNGVDLDDDTLTYGVQVQGTKGTVGVDENTGAYTYTPNENANGDDSFTLSVSDGTVVELAVLAVTINPINDIPVITPIPFTTLEDESFSGTIVIGDIQIPLCLIR